MLSSQGGNFFRRGYSLAVAPQEVASQRRRMPLPPVSVTCADEIDVSTAFLTDVFLSCAQGMDVREEPSSARAVQRERHLLTGEA